MDELQQFDQFLIYLLCILVPAAIIVNVYFYAMPTIRGIRNRHQPTITIPATVISKDNSKGNALYSGAAARFDGTFYCLTFKTKDGLLVTLTVPRNDYYNLKEGTTGTLTYQGTKCERFDPHK